MKKLLTTIILFLFSVAASGQDEHVYLCISEKRAQVLRPSALDSNESFSSASGNSEERFIINDEGLSFFGSNFPMLDFCSFHENGTVTCESVLGFGGWFQKMYNNLFTFTRPISNNGFTLEGIESYVGQCSKI